MQIDGRSSVTYNFYISVIIIAIPDLSSPPSRVVPSDVTIFEPFLTSYNYFSGISIPVSSLIEPPS